MTNNRTITIQLNALTLLIVFNILMLFAFIGLDFYSFNFIMQFLGNASQQQVFSSFSVIGYSVGINSNIGSNYFVSNSQRFVSPNLPFVAVLILVIGNVIGLAKLRKK